MTAPRLALGHGRYRTLGSSGGAAAGELRLFRANDRCVLPAGVQGAARQARECGVSRFL